MSESRVMRPIRSFVRREGRLTPGQQKALDELWPAFGIDDTHEPINLETLFGRDAPVVLEIGFGNGASLAEMAQSQPEQNFIGIEVHRPGVGQLLNSIQTMELKN
ncbi:MAG: tRNA (guanosine(46)-N7)-methyltransferase TrmB, partial [Pseudomonadota bacterium]|nr:tRNA (guanosine(46)-N7)-methyltransferase TrmB [Pseudomonadota bacterium]